jgi:hypothetical protein
MSTFAWQIPLAFKGLHFGIFQPAALRDLQGFFSVLA